MMFKTEVAHAGCHQCSLLAAAATHQATFLNDLIVKTADDHSAVVAPAKKLEQIRGKGYCDSRGR